MHYHEAMKAHPKGRCPFCHLRPEEIIKDYKHFVVIPTRAPYVEDHLLIIPKEHDVLMHEMTHERHIQMFKIIDERNERLHTYHKDTTLLLRDGRAGGTTGKSQDHIHFHLIPDFDLAQARKKTDPDRKFFDQEEYVALSKSLREKYL